MQTTHKRFRLYSTPIDWRTLRECRHRQRFSVPRATSDEVTNAPLRPPYAADTLSTFKARHDSQRACARHIVCRAAGVGDMSDCFAAYIPQAPCSRRPTAKTPPPYGQSGRNPRQEVVPTSCRGFLFPAHGDIPTLLDHTNPPHTQLKFPTKESFLTGVAMAIVCARPLLSWQCPKGHIQGNFDCSSRTGAVHPLRSAALHTLFVDA